MKRHTSTFAKLSPLNSILLNLFDSQVTPDTSLLFLREKNILQLLGTGIIKAKAE
jgi:hypothetical protein